MRCDEQNKTGTKQEQKEEKEEEEKEEFSDTDQVSCEQMKESKLRIGLWKEEGGGETKTKNRQSSASVPHLDFLNISNKTDREPSSAKIITSYTNQRGEKTSAETRRHFIPFQTERWRIENQRKKNKEKDLKTKNQNLFFIFIINFKMKKKITPANSPDREQCT